MATTKFVDLPLLTAALGAQTDFVYINDVSDPAATRDKRMVISEFTKLTLGLTGLTPGWVLSADTATTASWKASTGGASQLDQLSDVPSATNTNRFALMANGTTGYVGRALVEADISNLGSYASLAANSFTGKQTVTLITSQQRWAYDGSNFADITVGSTGNLLVQPSGEKTTIIGDGATWASGFRPVLYLEDDAGSPGPGFVIKGGAANYFLDAGYNNVRYWVYSADNGTSISIRMAHRGDVGTFGFGPSAPTNPQAVIHAEATAFAQFRASYDGSNYADFTVNSAGDLNINATGEINLTLPTSAAGLSAGDLWNNSGVVTIV